MVAMAGKSRNLTRLPCSVSSVTPALTRKAGAAAIRSAETSSDWPKSPFSPIPNRYEWQACWPIGMLLTS